MKKNEFICANSIQKIKEIEDQTIHAIISDIPYGISMEDWDILHSNTNAALMGSSPAQKTAGSVFKTRGKPINGWSEADRMIPQQYYEWCRSWSDDWFRIMKPGSSAFIFAGRRFSHRCICAMEDAGFNLKDTLAWLKSRAPHRAQRLSVVYEHRGDDANAALWKNWRVGNLRPLYEPILWFTKPYKIGATIADNVIHHGVGAYNQDAFKRYTETHDNVISIGFEPNETGLHPTQKPIRLMQVLIELVTIQGQIILDPFAGSGSTLKAAQNLGRDFIGIEIEQAHINQFYRA